MEKYNQDSKRVRQKTPDVFVKRTLSGELPGNAPEIRVGSSTSFSKSGFRPEGQPTNPNSRSVIIQQPPQITKTIAGHRSSEDHSHRRSSEISGTTYTDRFEEYAEINKPLHSEPAKNFTAKIGLPPQSPNVTTNPLNRRKSISGASP